MDFCQVFAGNFLFWGRAVGFDCIDSWSLLISLLWLIDLDLNIFRQINVIYLVFSPVNCLMSLTDLIHLRDRVHMPTFYSLLLMNPCDLNTSILHYMHFLVHPVTMTLHMPKHMRKYSCLLCTGYCSVLPVNWLLRVLYFAWLLIKGLSFDLVSHVDGKRVHKTKCNEWMQNKICSLWPTSYITL